MIITNINNESELLVDYSSLKRTRKVNGDYSLSFVVLKNDKSQYAYDLVEQESIVEYDGQQYRIKDVTEVLVGITPIKTVQAYHIFFDLVDTYKYDYIANTQSLQSCLNFILRDTGYTFEVVDAFTNVVFEKFGEDTSLSLLQDLLNTFNAEVQINNRHLRFYRQIGIDTEIQIRYGYNVQTLERYVNTNNLSTRIRGFGKRNEDDTFVTTAEYISPMASIYGIRDAKPVYDERYTIQSELLERIQNEIIDQPEISFKIDALELSKIGVLTENLNQGDRVFVIYEPLNVNLISRVLEIVDYPESLQPAEYTFGNFRNNLISELAELQRTKDNVDSILNGQTKLPYNVLDDAVLRATEALNSAATQLIFDNGIIARDPNDPNRVVLFNSSGIGISNNGGATFSEAITADGFVLSAGAIGSLGANNINVDTLSSITADLGTVTAGSLTGVTIQTDENPNNPRVVLNKDTLVAESGSNDFITINARESGYNYPTLAFYTQGNVIPARIHRSPREFIIEAVGDFRIVANNTIYNTAGNEFIRSVSIGGDLDVAGTKNASVPTSVGMVNISAYETAEYYFGDIGRGQVVNGECKIEIESIFSETVNTLVDYEVFLTPYGRGIIYVDEMNQNNFIVKGDDIQFAYEIKAKRKGYEDIRLELTKESEVEEIVQDASQK